MEVRNDDTDREETLVPLDEVMNIFSFVEAPERSVEGQVTDGVHGEAEAGERHVNRAMVHPIGDELPLNEVDETRTLPSYTLLHMDATRVAWAKQSAPSAVLGLIE